MTLITRLEQAKEGSRELDAEIALYAGVYRLYAKHRFIEDTRRPGSVVVQAADKGPPWTMEDAVKALCPCLSVPAYTSSLDAAMTLFADEQTAIEALHAAAYMLHGPKSKFDVIREVVLACLRAREGM